MARNDRGQTRINTSFWTTKQLRDCA